MFRTTGALVAAALGAAIVITPSSASAASEWYCYGTQVKRCATVRWDETAGTYRARAKITERRRWRQLPGQGHQREASAHRRRWHR
jgi:hypothetical protein